ncbi:hypothetical protein AJ80_02393 [Polytolypa hystricis UAMH7299]|uniref:Uncharacterized protein n=1 Tax=Polytolypa hystricis (strain UAMH7299) TaxID=1447883 RepID=A0A2B7YRW9_POLH7|nr:hypothetical protein AJ80_02393 [Polytolypa hystricis UAMH7299]
MLRILSGGYEDAKEIMRDVKSLVEKMGIQVVGDDEVVLEDGVKWEGALKVVACDNSGNDKNIVFQDGV